jgi:arylsulfatase
MPILKGGKRAPREVDYWHYKQGCAVRKDNWKLVKRDTFPWELYNLETDPVECTDLSEKYPDKVEYLKSLWSEWDKQGNSSYTH